MTYMIILDDNSINSVKVSRTFSIILLTEYGLNWWLLLRLVPLPMNNPRSVPVPAFETKIIEFFLFRSFSEFTEFSEKTNP